MIQGYPAIHTWHHEVQHSARGPIATGALIVLICGCGFGLWGGLAPLASAVVASGSFVATGQNKQVQHLEGESSRSFWSGKEILSRPTSRWCVWTIPPHGQSSVVS